MCRTILIVIFFLTGCSATGPTFERISSNRNDEATIYFYRPDTIFISGVGAYFLINGERVSKLQRNGYSYHFLKAGDHSIGMEWNCSLGACSKIMSADYTSMQNKPVIDVRVKPGEQRFFKLVLDQQSWSWGFKEVERDAALSEIKDARSDNDL